MEDFSISFVPKTERGKAQPVQNHPHRKPQKKMIEATLSRDEKKVVHERYTGEKERNIRSFTAPFSEDWSFKEDTTLKDYSKQEFVFKKKKEDEFSRPSRHRNRPPEETRQWGPRDTRLWRSNNDVFVQAKERNITPPIIEWDSFSILPHILIDSLLQCNYFHPLPVQSQCIPLSLDGCDVIGLSQPGTGKTLAYAVPLICTVMKYLEVHQYSPTDGALGVVLVPTHELANQVHEVISSICISLGINTFALTGGFSITDQALTLRHGYQIIVATPGRLDDVLNGHLMAVDNCQFVVLDEADKMIDRSFSSQIESILSSVSPDKRLLMFSATMPEAVMTIVEKFFTNVVKVRVGQIGDASENITQVVHYTSVLERDQRVIEDMHGLKQPILVFANTRESCEHIANVLGNEGFRVAFIHGGKAQKDREAVIDALQDGIIDIIVATDVLSRGIDIDSIENVVNYQVPEDISVYVHRIGRTGRAGKRGTAISYVTPEDRVIMYDLRRLLERNKIEVPEGMKMNPDSMTKVRPDYEQYQDYRDI
ncbi:Pre-mRNA-splicing ATP-dependent RNA helicase PRP28 [Histomonas meleagridis]|uniref:Pre-mRNA-splicing ATP-dependent RNA helicase PRP28 n=1 Tax=Histomonas meleagridis TaxID=135588 RepID=UPI00355A2347|nr:Pre-mRNA-splicing ATP-dependent RNA helicase PRP28 [Histomonas meleagridis]KAH0801331.1 Pre-mRNA-splicing ATP-dependent RNA helicase PRP28 [Histomonas meleagridis]